MVIAVNTRLLIDNIHGGIEWFTYEIMKRVTGAHPEHRFIFLFDRPFNNKYIFSENVEGIVAPPRAIHPLLWRYWNENVVRSVIKNHGADLYISPDGMIPLRSSIPCIPVIHDIGFIHRPSDIPLLKSLFYRRYFPRYAKVASRIITVSRYSAKDIAASFDIDPEKIDIVYNGASDEFYPDTSPLYDIMGSDMKMNPYFLFVGNLSPRKNVPNMIRAFNRFREKSKAHYSLVIAGDRFFLNGELDKVYSRSPYKKDIIFTGSQNRDQLRRLYSNSTALLFVPWFEGFGIPVIEAMKCGTPVISSSATSLPEIAGDAALFSKPYDIESIADNMCKITGDNNLRDSLVQKGFANSSKYRWDSASLSFWNSIEKVINTI